MTQRDLTTFAIRLASLLFFFRMAVFLPYQINTFVLGESAQSNIPLFATAFAMALAVFVWMKPGCLLFGARSDEKQVPLETLEARALIVAGMVMIGIYFAGTGLENLTQTGLQLLSDQLSDDGQYRGFPLAWSISDAFRFMFGGLLIVKAPVLTHKLMVYLCLQEQ